MYCIIADLFAWYPTSKFNIQFLNFLVKSYVQGVIFYNKGKVTAPLNIHGNTNNAEMCTRIVDDSTTVKPKSRSYSTNLRHVLKVREVAMKPFMVIFIESIFCYFISKCININEGRRKMQSIQQYQIIRFQPKNMCKAYGKMVMWPN